MRYRTFLGALAASAVLTTMAGPASALNKRAELTQQGDFVLIGNTLAQDCGASVPAPVVGAAMCAGAGDLNDLSPDIWWRAEANSAVANASIPVEQARTTAILKLPVSATVTRAYIYWAARRFTGPDNTATLEFVGANALNVQATGSLVGSNNVYHSVADVTEYVKANGGGAYRVTGVDSVPLNGVTPEPFGLAVWWMVVLYESKAEPHRYLALYDGLDPIENGAESTVSITGLAAGSTVSWGGKRTPAMSNGRGSASRARLPSTGTASSSAFV